MVPKQITTLAQSLPLELNPMSIALPAVAQSEPRQQMFGINIDVLNMKQAVERVYSWLEQSENRCRFVVTPNVDHVVQYQENPELRAAYQKASLVVADGWPLVMASRLFGKALPERVPGSDLVPNLFSAASNDRPLRVFLLGAAPGVAIRAAEQIHRRWENVNVVGTYSPPIGFEKDEYENAYILGRVALVKPDVLVVGLGAPKQELWVSRFQGQLDTKVALCVGATIDFLAGQKRRAPKFIQNIGLEWMHRMLSEPSRLVKRYAHDARVFPGLVWQQFRREYGRY